MTSDSCRSGVDRRTLRQAAAGSVALAGSFTRGQSVWPDKPVDFVVPFPSGGGTDAFARPLDAQLTRALGKQVIIDNRDGAGGTAGAAIASKAAPDGCTFCMGAVHHAIAPSMYPRLDYNRESDFMPVGLISNVPQVIGFNPQHVQAAELRTSPGKLNCASAGNGTSRHIAAELFKLQTKTFIRRIPYRGAGPALQDPIPGQVDMMFDGLGSSATHIKSGRTRALAMASKTRAPGFPEVPTHQVATWYGFWASKSTPKDVVEHIQAEIRKTLTTPELQATWNGLGIDRPNLYRNAFGGFVSSETKRWAEVMKTSGAKLNG